MIRRSNFAIGIGASAVVHGALLAVLLSAGGSAPPQAQPQRPTPVQIASVDPQRMPLDPLPQAPPDPASAPPEAAPAPVVPVVPAGEPAKRAAARPVSEAPPEPLRPAAAEPKPPPPPAPAARAARPEPPPAPRPALGVTERVASPAQEARAPTNPAPRQAPPAPRAPEPAGGDKDGVPPLRVHWNDASELVAVARALDMRLAAVDRHGDIVAEIDVTGNPGLASWRGLPAGYSNRVRMLSPSLFSAPLGPPGGPEIHEIWVFVPAARDRAMIEAQQEAAQRSGVLPADVLYMDGRFVPSGGSYELMITGVKRRARGTAARG